VRPFHTAMKGKKGGKSTYVSFAFLRTYEFIIDWDMSMERKIVVGT